MKRESGKESEQEWVGRRGGIHMRERIREEEERKAGGRERQIFDRASG